VEGDTTENLGDREGKRMRRDNKRHCVWKFTVVVLMHNCSSWGWIQRSGFCYGNETKLFSSWVFAKSPLWKLSRQTKKKKNNRRLFILPPLSTRRDILFCIVNTLQSLNSWQIFGWSWKGLDLLCPAVRHAIESKNYHLQMKT